MYGGPSVDPTHGRVKWHQLDRTHWKDKERPPLGAHNTREYDEQHGRWWHEKKEEWRPKLYTTIGKPARSKKTQKDHRALGVQQPRISETEERHLPEEVA